MQIKSMPLAPTFLIYRTGFAPTNGHSVQLERLFRQAGMSLVHLMWYSSEAGAQSVPWVIDTTVKLVKLPAPFTPLSRTCQRVKHLFFRPWWYRKKFDSARLARELAAIPIKPRQAYVNFFSEPEAAMAETLWDSVGRPPFVLHIVDILEPGLSVEKTPHFVRMIRAASHVLCLNGLIQREMARLGACTTSLFPLCSDLTIAPRTAPPLPLKIVMSGALYAPVLNGNRALQLLADIWPRVIDAFPGAQLHYSGAAGRALPEAMRPYVHDHGLLNTDDYRQLLGSCHVAYVPVSHPDDSMLRYSLPSRIPDYLILGLPVIACVGPDTGMYDFFQTTPPETSRVIQTGDEFLAALEFLARDARQWENASHIATAYSQKTFAVESARQLLFDRLNAAGNSQPGT